MAIEIDTLVVLRLLIGEPRAQAEVARRRIERALIRSGPRKPWGKGREDVRALSTA